MFNIRPENHQPKGVCDFSKLYNPKNITVYYTNLDTSEKEQHNVERTEHIDNNGKILFIYKIPEPFVKNKSNLP